MRVLRLSAIVPFVAAVALLSSCTTATNEQGSLPVTVPVDELVNTVAITSKVTDLRLINGEVCPVVDFDGEEALLVLPTGAVATTEPLSVSYDDATFSAGDNIVSTPFAVIEDGFECGGQLWEPAVRLKGLNPGLSTE